MAEINGPSAPYSVFKSGLKNKTEECAKYLMILISSKNSRVL